VRYPAAALADYVDWMRERTTALDLPYLDLHDLLAPEEFVDSLHPTARGQARIAARLALRLEELMAAERKPR
jgi:lysophospholipase L1-like esterase